MWPFFLETPDGCSTRLNGEDYKFKVYIARHYLKIHEYKQINPKDDHNSKGVHIQGETDSE